jgi:hypothetical protein
VEIPPMAYCDDNRTLEMLLTKVTSMQLRLLLIKLIARLERLDIRKSRNFFEIEFITPKLIFISPKIMKSSHVSTKGVRIWFKFFTILCPGWL